MNAAAFNRDVNRWNTANVKYMYGMFKDASAFSNHDLSSWNVASVTDHSYFCNGWGTGNTPPGGWSCR